MVIGILRAVTAPMPPPIASAVPISNQVVVSAGAPSRPSVVSTAIVMPIMP